VVKLDGLTTELLTALPVDRRAVELLRAITADEPRNFFGNRESVRLGLEQNAWRSRQPAAARAYEEAFDWLQRHGLVSREPSQDGPDWFFVTDAGWEVAAGDDGAAKLAATERLSVDLHPRIAARVRSQYLLGEYEAAALLAMREIEIRVRDLAGAGNDDLGVALMKEAFKQGGPLAEPALEVGEQQATMALFWGAIGVFKNPSSHRQVDYEDPTLASEIILFADLLHRMLDRVEARRQAQHARSARR
jgi:uncharacterized protein (TIGR02391 family)